MTQFRKRSDGPSGPDAYRAAARKLRRFADRLDAQAADDPRSITRLLRDLAHYAQALARRHQEPPMPALKITVPADVSYADLRLTRDPVTGEATFDWAPIERICEASGIDIAVFRDAHEDNIAGLLVDWYRQHLANGGAPDPVQEQICAEVEAEDELGAHRVQIGSGRAQ